MECLQVSGAVQNTSCALSHGIFTTASWGCCCYHLHWRGKKANGSERSGQPPKATQLTGDRARTWAQCHCHYLGKAWRESQIMELQKKRNTGGRRFAFIRGIFFLIWLHGLRDLSSPTEARPQPWKLQVLSIGPPRNSHTTGVFNPDWALES